MKRVSLIILAQLVCFCASGQEKYPALTNVISFSELQKKSIERNLEWRNPDGSQEEIKILEMAIPFGEAMKQQTREFVLSVYGLNSIWLDPKMIVFHAMGDGDLKTSLEVSSFLNDQIPASWGNLSKAGLLSNGAHFIIDHDGTIICLAPPHSGDGKNVSYEQNNHKWWVKRHQDGNPVAIGIENVTDMGDYTHFTQEQITSNAKLARWLSWFENGKIEFVASHHQFNDDKEYDRFLRFFSLQNQRRQFRTQGRADIGNENLREILNRLKSSKVPLKNFFE